MYYSFLCLKEEEKIFFFFLRFVCDIPTHFKTRQLVLSPEEKCLITSEWIVK
jgi:hypothetical protein